MVWKAFLLDIHPTRRGKITALADDGHRLVATLTGDGTHTPFRLAVIAEPLRLDDDPEDAPPRRRFPTIPEFCSAADELTPAGTPLAVMFPSFGQDGQRPPDGDAVGVLLQQIAPIAPVGPESGIYVPTPPAFHGAH